MTRLALGYLPALALLAALAGCAARAPFELPDLDAPASASTEVKPQGSYPAYRYGYRPYGPYGSYSYGHYGSSSQPRNQDGTPGAAPVPAPVPVVPEPPPPRPPRVEREPREMPVRTTRPADDTPARRQQER
jgi:predicted small lipoprotein YifL